MTLDILRGELERLFELDELLRLSRDLLGFDPEQVGGISAKGSFAAALTEHCLEADALEALCDAVLASKADVHPAVAELRITGPSVDEDLGSGSVFAGYTIVRKLGEGRAGLCYVATKDGEEYRLKVLRNRSTRDRAGLHQMLTLSRLLGGIEHVALPKRLEAGSAQKRFYVAHAFVEAPTLAARMSRIGPTHLNEARGLLRGIAAVLAALHERRIAHGNLKLENVLVIRSAAGEFEPLLLDAGCDRLRVRGQGTNGKSELSGFAAGAAPEQLRGLPVDPRSDVYAFGVLLYQVLTGKSPFPAQSAIESILMQLTAEPPRPSSVAPRGWVSERLEALVLSLLTPDPNRRPRNGAQLLQALDDVDRSSVPRQVTITDSELNERIDFLIADPTDEAALRLENAIEEGASAERIAEAFWMAADAMVADDSQRSAAKHMLLRAGRLYEREVQNPDKAEESYARALAIEPDDEVAAAALIDVRKRAGKYEEVVEMLLSRAEKADNGPERSRLMAEIGRIYARDLDDREQAVVAYAQAFCEDPSHLQYAHEIERLAGGSQDTWGEVLGACTEAVSSETLADDSKNILLNQMGAWYLEKVSRSDLALPCFQTVINTDPANTRALRGMAQVYRKAQQWPELGMVLSRWADAAPTPAQARDLRAESAEILEHQMNDVGGARNLYAQILDEDPGHGKASEALARIYEQAKDWAAYVKLLERRQEASRGEDKLKALCRLAEIYEDHLRQDEEAIHRYDCALEVDPKSLDALRGLERIYARIGRYKELLLNLTDQLAIAATPRQKITLLTRIAAIHDEEFLDHEAAAVSFEQVLRIDNAHEPALTALVRHYRALDRWEEVASVYARHLKLVTDKEQRIELAMACGRVFAENIGSPERATAAYEMVLELDTQHAGALEALARLRETAGDADAALQAIETLAAKATTPEAKAEQYVRAAKLLESRGDRDGAIDRYKRAWDANPRDLSIAGTLRQAYLARGDLNAAVQLLEREIEQIDGDRAKAKLAGEMALLMRVRLKDDQRAEQAARRAVSLDPTNLPAQMVLADLAFEGKHYLEAARYYQVLAERADTLPKEEAARILVRYVDALSQSGSTEKALAPMDTLLRIAPDDQAALERVAAVTFEHGSPKRAAELYKDLLARFPMELHGRERALAYYRYGESLRRSGDLKPAIEPLELAYDLDTGDAEPLIALAKTHEGLEQWADVVRAKTRHLDIAAGDMRVQLLMDIGDIAAGKLNDRTQATKSYVAALEEHPDDRRLLTKLMQLYSEEKDWNRLIEVVLRLADFVEDPKQKVKYLHTAAIVSYRQMGDIERALDFYEQVIDLDPSMQKPIDEAIEIQTERRDYAAVERLLRRKLRAATEAQDEKTMLETFNRLGELYETKLESLDKAIDAFEAAHTLDPDNQARTLSLSDLYAKNPQKYLDKALAAHAAILRENPYRPESYKALRKLYTEAKRADAAWCTCQALYVLGIADPDEERFFKRMRAETAAEAQSVLTDEDWLSLMHGDADPLLTSVFALIEGAVIAKRGMMLAELGYDPNYAVDLSAHPSLLAQNLHYAAGVLGMIPPPTYENPNDPGGLMFLHAHEPSVVLGHAALNADVPPQPAAFIAARHLTYFRPGMYVRQLIPTGTGLKSWLFAAIKMMAPQFPVAPDLEGPVTEALKALDTGIQGAARDHLSRVVSKLIQSGAALDLKRWVAGIDLTADRAGYLLCNDLETSLEIIKASDESASAVPNQERAKELILYTVGEQHLELRTKLGISLDS